MMIFFSQKIFSFSILGISVIGAVSHNLTQLVIVRFLIIKSNSIFHLVPFLILFGIIGGMIIGYLGYYFSIKIKTVLNSKQAIKNNFARL